MGDITSIKDIIECSASLIATGVAVLALIKSSRQKQDDAADARNNKRDDQMTALQSQLTQHVLDDARSITELRSDINHNTQVTTGISTKIDELVSKLITKL